MDSLDENTFVQKRAILDPLFEARRALMGASAGSMAAENARKGALEAVNTTIKMVHGLPGTVSPPPQRESPLMVATP